MESEPKERSPVKVGDILADKYQVERIIGTGGMGVVVAATHVDLHELRALKFMLPKANAHPEAVKRFLREARATVRLKSQYVAQIHDIGRLESGAPYMVMEYLEGRDLREILEDVGSLPIDEAVDYVMMALVGLAEAHAMGIVHRDLKPANLFVSTGADGRPCVKLLDFGISKLVGELATAPGMDMTKTSTTLGSPHYMSPEQMECSGEVDARSDIWSLGVILYEAIVGTVPFDGPSLTAVTIMVVNREPVEPSALDPQVPDALDWVLLRCLEKDPAERFDSVADLAEELARFGSERSRKLLDLVRLTHAATDRPAPASPSRPAADRPSGRGEDLAETIQDKPLKKASRRRKGSRRTARRKLDAPGEGSKRRRGKVRRRRASRPSSTEQPAKEAVDRSPTRSSWGDVDPSDGEEAGLTRRRSTRIAVAALIGAVIVVLAVMWLRRDGAEPTTVAGPATPTSAVASAPPPTDGVSVAPSGSPLTDAGLDGPADAADEAAVAYPVAPPPEDIYEPEPPVDIYEPPPPDPYE